MAAYPFSEIEPKWQKFWDENKINKIEDDFSKPKYYILDMFPYPSGAGLHIGHPEGYTATDIIGRYKRMKGFNVLHPMGYDAFGLPTERYSMQTGIHPKEVTAKNTKNFTNQLKALGFAYDWDRTVNTTDESYYKWTQWMFLKIYNSYFDEILQKAMPIEFLSIPENLVSQEEIDAYIDSQRLAFIAMIPVNWCEELGTVLANEECDEWREKGYTVERKPMRQWMIRITKYAQRLLDDLEIVEWPHSTKEMQKNWIGKSEGAEIDFFVPSIQKNIRVFTTRPDTLFGATYMVVAPEHGLVNELTTADQKAAIEAYITTSSLKSDLERTELNKEKSGVFTGSYAINPATGAEIPIWIADYVLAHYGTGAIMAVPGHDLRDNEFAQKYSLPILKVVENKENLDFDVTKEAFCEDGYAVNSEKSEVSINGKNTPEAKSIISNWLENKGIGKKKIQFKLRDWLFSRQRYWGEPMPIMFFEDGTRRGLDEDELPLVLPNVKDFKPAGTGESPLANVEEWVNFIDKKTGKKARYETNTMPQWAGSCWYYLRYIDPQNPEIFAAKDKEEYWMGDGGIDLYVGGAEHAVLHLLYARFWHKVLFDYGVVSTPEPFKKLFHQGLIMGLSYRNKNNVLIPNDLVESKDGKFFDTRNGEELEEIVAKMSKSLKNVINPDDVIKDFGADSLRIFEMFLGPLEASKPWSKSGIEGINRFLNRAWRLIATEESTLSDSVQDVPMTSDQEFALHCTIKKIGEDIENLSFNTAVSQMMIFVNEFTSAEIKSKEAMEKFVLCLAPFAPHLCEELWRILGHTNSIVLEKYPEYDITKTVKSEVEIVIQVTSKIRGKLIVPLDADQSAVEELAMKDESVLKHLDGKPIRKVIYVKNKLINFIV
jgi:leucyl-tRNA synthetase